MDLKGSPLPGEDFRCYFVCAFVRSFIRVCVCVCVCVCEYDRERETDTESTVAHVFVSLHLLKVLTGAC